jgi:hypothetical protein
MCQPGARRRLWTRSLALVLPLALVLFAFLAPTGAAATQTSPAWPTEAEGKWEAGGMEGGVKITCTQVSWTFNIPNAANNTVSVTEILNVGGSLSATTFSFDGPTGSHTTTIAAPPRPHGIRVQAKWRVGKLHGHFATWVKLACPTAPAFSIEKLQAIAGGGSYTTSQLAGQVGQTVDYEILVKNTGNVSLTLGGFTDPQCDAGTISGGPASGTLAPEAWASYLCTHLLGGADQSAGSYSNTATVTANMTGIEGWPVTHTSNTVVVQLPTSSPTTSSPTTSTTLPPSFSSSSPTSHTQSPGSGVLAFKSAAVPTLRGPQGCVRGSFRVSMRSAGVASVTFYLDGRKLKTLTAKNAHKGELTILIDPAKLSVGVHRLAAKITTSRTAATQAAHASRAVTVLRCRSAVQTPKFAG